MNYKINIYDKFDIQLETVWKKFEKNSFYHIFQKYEWIKCWQENIGEKKFGFTPQIIEIKENSETIFLFPLGLRRRFSIKILETLGGSQSDYQSPIIHKNIYSNKDKQKSIFIFLKNNLPKHDIFIISNQPQYIFPIENFFFDIGKIKNEKSYNLQIQKLSYETFISTVLKKKIRNDTRRQKKRLSEKGKLKFKIAKTQKEFDFYFDLLVKHKSDQYIRTNAFDIFSDKRIQNFYKNLLKDSHHKEITNLSILMLNEEVLALHLGFLSKKVFYYIMPTYNISYLKYSPGRILLENLIEWSFNNKVEFFDFCTGNEKYKFDWTNNSMKVSEKKIIKNFKGFLYFCIHEIFLNMKMVYKKSFLLKRFVTADNVIIKRII